MQIASVAPSSSRRTANNQPVNRGEVIAWLHEMIGTRVVAEPQTAADVHA
jgi:hypothetical protein